MVKNKSYAIVNYNYFCFNFNSNFIEECWKDRPDLIGHLHRKFHESYKKFGSVGAVPAFMTELSRDNQLKFAKWINKNYKGLDDNIKLIIQ